MTNQFVDISNHNHIISDWGALRTWSLDSQNKARVLMKATEGVGFRDPSFSDKWKKAVDNGFDYIGVYAYARPDLEPGTPGAIATADYFLSQVNGVLRPGDFVMLDYEQVGPGNLAEWAYQFMAHIRLQTGRNCYVYSYLDFIRRFMQDSRLAQFPLGYARWTFDPNARPPCPPPWKSYAWVQYSDRAMVPGIEGPVDANTWVASAPVALNTSARGSKVILKHPGPNDRYDLLYVGTDTPNRVWHNVAMSLPDLTKSLNSSTWETPAGVALAPLSLSATWDNTGNVLTAVAAAQGTGQLYTKSVDVNGAVVQEWAAIAGQSEEVPAPPVAPEALATVTETYQAPGGEPQTVTYHVVQ